MGIVIAIVVVCAVVWFNTWHERRTTRHLYDFFKRDRD